MNILILTHFMGRGGSSTLAAQVRDRLRLAGHQAQILATNRTDDCISEDAEFLFHKPNRSQKPTVLCLLEKIKELKPDLVYSISGVTEMEVLRFLKIPRVRHFSSLESHNHLDIHHVFQQCAPYFDGVTANTPDVLDTLRSWSPESSFGTATFPYALNEELWPAIPNVPAESGNRPIQICFIGRLEPYQKRADWLPTIISLTSKGNVPVEWHIYGDGPLRASVTESIQGIHPSVSAHFHNWISQSDLISRLPSHDLFFLCSRWEGLPIAMVEAMLCGVPCLVPDKCAGAGYALDSGGGWIYRADSPQACAARIIQVISDSAALHQDKIQVSRIARDKFLGAIPAQQTLNCINMFETIRFNGFHDDPSGFRPISPLPPLRHLRSRIISITNRIYNRLHNINS